MLFKLDLITSSNLYGTRKVCSLSRFFVFRQVYSCLNLFHHVVVGLSVGAVQVVVVDEALHGEQVLANSMWVGIFC